MSQFTTADVASHNNADKGLYIIIDSNVYDVTNFIDEHPGGAKILKRVAGKDASKQFWKVSFPPIIWIAGLCCVVFMSASVFDCGRSANHFLPTVPQRKRAEEILAKVEDWGS